MSDPELPAPPAVREYDTARDPESDAALQRYRERQRRPRLIYAAVVSVIVIALGVVAIVAWTRGETNNTTLRTVSEPPSDLAVGTPVTAPKFTWRSGDVVATGAPQWGGTVVASSTHTVHGIDARTGKTTWSYRRSDRTVCTAAQLGGVTVAIYRLRGNCDEVTALDSETGERRWTRTLDMDGMPVNGTPVVTAGSTFGTGTVLVRTSSVIYALDPASGYNRWTYTRYGCRITGATVGSAGGLVSQTCSSKVVCGKLKFCGTGPQLFLLPNGGFNRDDAMKDTNPDHITWNRIGTNATPASAGTLVSAVDRSGTLLHLDPKSGRTTARTTLAPVPDPPYAITTTEIESTQLVSIDGDTYALRAGTAEPVWRRIGIATVAATDATADPELASARVTIRTSEGVATVDPRTGRVTATYALSRAPAGGTAYALGQGFLVSTSSATVGYA